MKIIATKNAPGAIGPYSQAVEANGTLYCSGQIAIVPETGEMLSGGAAEQSRQVMKNLQSILAEAGLSFSNVVKTTCYLADMKDFAVFNEIYAEFMGDNRPARACVAVRELPKGALVEVDAIAVMVFAV